jgi:hypothetical protein
MNRTLAGYLVVMLWVATAVWQCAAEIHLKPEGQLRWYKGVTHFHTLWSDGDCAPEVAVKWYLDSGYDFVSVTDHDILATGERWIPVSDEPDSKLTSERVAMLQVDFGEDWVELRDVEDGREMRLKNLRDLNEAFNTPGSFLMIPGEEVTAKMAVHLNAINIEDTIDPVEGETVVETLRKNYEAIEAHAAAHGLNTLVHINHPNWGSHITAEEIVTIGGERFFEVFNGHGGVRNWGDPNLHILSTDRLWDIILTHRFHQGDTDKPMYAVATDDAHNWFKRGVGSSIPGRGWIMVLADSLETDTLIDAMKAGRFYSTSGVVIDEVHISPSAYAVHIRPEPGVTYTTQFFGSPKDVSLESEPVVDAEGNEVRATRKYSAELGQIFLETTENPAVYPITGNEQYVRAKVISSKLKEDPFKAGDLETAWLQPVRVP